ncbi:hypothetical protein Avbf_17045 [Armadillidium vulgare]|nr:hypothetical protein Avbf_17045 [Armadillidium vulgare]
MCGVGSIISL